MNNPTVTAAKINTASSYAAAASQVSQTLGARPTNKTLNTVAQIAGIAALIPPPGVFSAAAGAVAVVAQVLSSVFRGGPTVAQQLNSIRQSNDQLRMQIRTIDEQTAKMNEVLETMRAGLQRNGFRGFSGLFTSKKKREQKQTIFNEAQSTEQLQNMLADKGRNLQVLIETFNVSLQNTYDAIYGRQQANNIVFYGLIVLGLAVGIYGLTNKK